MEVVTGLQCVVNVAACGAPGSAAARAAPARAPGPERPLLWGIHRDLRSWLQPADGFVPVQSPYMASLLAAPSLLCAAAPVLPVAPATTNSPPNSQRSLLLAPLQETELLVAGFPCVDVSRAGLRRGLEGQSTGLVRHVFRLLQVRASERRWVGPLRCRRAFLAHCCNRGGGSMRALAAALTSPSLALARPLPSQRAKDDRRPVPWVLLENVRLPPPPAGVQCLNAHCSREFAR